MACSYPEAMGYFKRGDIPYYYALADAFTLCEAYHQSMMGPTNPNRLYHHEDRRAAPSGDGKDARHRQRHGRRHHRRQRHGGLDHLSRAAKRRRRGPAGLPRRLPPSPPGTCTSTPTGNTGSGAEQLRLQRLAWCRNFKNAPREFGPSAQRAVLARGAEPSVAQGCAGEHAAAGVVDRRALLLLGEHPRWGPSFGEYHVTRAPRARRPSNPEVWARTVFILNYDEGDGFYDHASAPVPLGRMASAFPRSAPPARSSTQRLPIGLGHRNPADRRSRPWSKGGKVSAEVFDHTSVCCASSNAASASSRKTSRPGGAPSAAT
ncbi:alkaline phosphatase family protein [Pseudomonas aeruginosa]|nr:alkaline phosphatase family protein [Pseudomonas aeruginosa]